MPISWLKWRALAVLGALLLVISIWPLACAALPIELLTFPSNLSNNQLYPSAMTTYNSDIFEFKTNHNSDKLNLNHNLPWTKTVFLRRKRKKINPNNRSTSYTIRNYFNVPRTSFLKKGTSSTTTQNDLYLASTPSSLSITTYQPDVGFVKLSLNNSQEMRLSTTNRRNAMIASQHKNAQITASINLIQNQTDKNNVSQNDDNHFEMSKMFLNESNTTIVEKTLVPTMQTVFYSNTHNSKSVQVTSTESIFSRTERSVLARKRGITGKRNSNLDRNERSTNFSHITGTSRKIKLLIKNRLLQLLPDGTVNGTQDDGSDYTILQRATVDVGKIRIQGVATCLFLCMDACGNVYGAKEFTDDCVFNESMLENYNIYASTYHSNAQKIFYLALNKWGQPRKTHLPANKELGKMATYAKSFTFTVDEKRTDELLARLFGSNHVKHGLKQLCDSGKSLVDLVAKKMKQRIKCNLRKFNKTKSIATNGAIMEKSNHKVSKCTEESCQRKKKNHSIISSRSTITKIKKNRKNSNKKNLTKNKSTKSMRNLFLSSLPTTQRTTTTIRPYRSTTISDEYPITYASEQMDDDSDEDIDESTLHSLGTTFILTDNEDDDMDN